MRRIEIIRVLRNVGSNGLALAINVLVGVFLSPFILHRLGDTAFGIWVLIFSIAGYYGLFDLGIRSSIVRYVSRARANNDWEDASCVISTSLFSYSCIGIFALLVTATLSLFMGKFHSISPPFQATARWLLIMVGSAVSLGFPLGVFGGVLEALQRFELQSSINIASTLIRALLIVLALTHGYGLLTIAFITVMLPILSSVLRALITFRLIPVRLGPAYVRRSTFRQIANYSGFSFIAIVSGRLRFKSDEIIIGRQPSTSRLCARFSQRVRTILAAPVKARTSLLRWPDNWSPQGRRSMCWPSSTLGCWRTRKSAVCGACLTTGGDCAY